MKQLGEHARSMATNIGGLLKTVSGLEDSSQRVTQALESAVQAIEREENKCVLPPPHTHTHTSCLAPYPHKPKRQLHNSLPPLVFISLSHAQCFCFVCVPVFCVCVCVCVCVRACVRVCLPACLPMAFLALLLRLQHLVGGGGGGERIATHEQLKP